VLVGDPGQLVEAAARQRAEAMKMRFQPAKIIRLQIEPEQIAQAAVDRIEILSRAIGRDVIGAATPGSGGDERFVSGGRVHV
jgi:hypothetical protein